MNRHLMLFAFVMLLMTGILEYRKKEETLCHITHTAY